MNFRIKLLIALITLIATIHLSYSFGALNQTVTLSSAVCQNLVKGQNATENFVASTCIISASTNLSPFFLTNFTTILIIPSGSGLTLNSGFGFANYGEINNSGVMTQKVPLINYGQILNFASWSVQSTFVQMNDTGATVLTTGFVTNQPTGTITISSGSGFFYNGNRLINNGVITNNGLVCNHISGLGRNGTITGSISGNAISINC